MVVCSVPKLGTELLEIFGDGLYSPRTVGSFWVMTYALNHVLMCRRSDMAVEIGFKKWNKCWMSGQPRTAHMLFFWGY